MSKTFSEKYLRVAISKAYILGVDDSTKRRTDPSIKFRDFYPLIERIIKDVEKYVLADKDKEAIE